MSPRQKHWQTALPGHIHTASSLPRCYYMLKVYTGHHSQVPIFKLFIWKSVLQRERQRESETEREKAIMVSTGSGWSQQPRSSSPMWVQVPEDLHHFHYFSQAISRELIYKWISQDANWHWHGMPLSQVAALPAAPQWHPLDRLLLSMLHLHVQNVLM